MPRGLRCGAYYSNCTAIGHFTCQTAYVTWSGGLLYCNQTLFLRKGGVWARDYETVGDILLCTNQYRLQDLSVVLVWFFYIHTCYSPEDAVSSLSVIHGTHLSVACYSPEDAVSSLSVIHGTHSSVACYSPEDAVSSLGVIHGTHSSVACTVCSGMKCNHIQHF